MIPQAVRRRVRLRRSSLEWSDVSALLWPARKPLVLGLLLTVIARLSGFVLPLASKYLMDEVVLKQRWQLLSALSFAIGGAVLIQSVSVFTVSWILGTTSQRMIASVRRRLYAHVIRLPIAFFDGTKSGVLVSRIMSDPEGLRHLVGTGALELAGSLISVSLSLALLFWLNWRLTGVIILALGAALLVFGSVFRLLRPMHRERARLMGEITGRLSESLSGVRVVKSYAAEAREAVTFAKGVHRLVRVNAKSLAATSGLSAFATLMLGVFSIAIVVFGGMAIRGRQMTPGDLLMYLMVVGLVATPLMHLASLVPQVSEVIAALERITELQRLETERRAVDNTRPVPPLVGDLEFRDVSFAYTAGVPVLRNLSFRAGACTTTALVGPSGAGKSTLASLILAFNHPASGQVLVDGRDISGLTLTEYRRHLGVVLENNFLFDGTVAENIRYSRPRAARQQVLDAGRLAHCDEFVRSLPHGYDTVIGERGIKLSGGQRQRVAIARAILADPRILILDEATSNLDSESELLIQDGLKSLRRGRTTVVIAHRLSTIRDADQILVLERGEIVERGPHDALLARNGRYRELYDTQYRFERDRAGHVTSDVHM